MEPVNKHKDAIYAADHDAFIKHSGVWKYAKKFLNTSNYGIRKFEIRLLIQRGIMGNNNRTRFYAVLLGVLLVSARYLIAQSVNSVELTSSILENMSGVANKEFSLSIILQ